MRLVLVLVIIFLFSCKGKDNVKKYHIIPSDSIVDVLIDYHLSQGVNYTDYYRDKMKDQKQVNINDSVLKEHGYNKAIFDSSIAYYSSKPQLFDQIYDKVISRLSRMQAEVQKKMVTKKPTATKKILPNKKK